ncbi:DUF1848 domain-containing protein [Anaerosporobacter sp.]|uniref:DUF1848 domain-containing protein n=1 Tax=Anaerosporobacter sp. TaxID=1872529 RepID=UPI002F3F0BDB
MIKIKEYLRKEKQHFHLRLGKIMIISASRRTDIPAFFSDWFINRITEKYAYVRNPMNTHQVSKVNLSPDVVDCIVFWSKNPKPIIDKLDILHEYMYYFQFTLNAYDKDIETNLPDLDERINTFQMLSNTLGKQRVIWRYDPIILNEKYTVEWHIEKFNYIASKLCDYTEKATISFIDLYTKISSNIKGKNIHELSHNNKMMLAKELSLIAHSFHLKIDTCAEDIDLSSYNIEHARCIDGRLIAKLLGCSLDIEKDKNQRLECGCVTSIDLGLYNTCQNGCVYCYANHNTDVRNRILQTYDKNAPLLCSQLTELDKVTERKVKSQKNMQLNLFSI